MQYPLTVAYISEDIPLTEKEYIEEVVAASQRVKSGEFIRHEAFEEQVLEGSHEYRKGYRAKR